jgi:hypothetical protein
VTVKFFNQMLTLMVSVRHLHDCLMHEEIGFVHGVPVYDLVLWIMDCGCLRAKSLKEHWQTTMSRLALKIRTDFHPIWNHSIFDGMNVWQVSFASLPHFLIVTQESMQW